MSTILQFFQRRNSTNLVSTCLEYHEDSKTIEISQRSHRSWSKNHWEANDLSSPHVAHRLAARLPLSMFAGLGVTAGRHMQSFGGRSTMNRRLSWEERREKDREERDKEKREAQGKKRERQLGKKGWSRGPHVPAGLFLKKKKIAPKLCKIPL